jgi:hypothetical protein
MPLRKEVLSVRDPNNGPSDLFHGFDVGMTKSMAKEFGSRNVCVNAVCPGFIESDMTKNLDKDALLSFIPLKRYVASLRG